MNPYRQTEIKKLLRQPLFAFLVEPSLLVFYLYTLGVVVIIGAAWTIYHHSIENDDICTIFRDCANFKDADEIKWFTTSTLTIGFWLLWLDLGLFPMLSWWRNEGKYMLFPTSEIKPALKPTKIHNSCICRRCEPCTCSLCSSKRYFLKS